MAEQTLNRFGDAPIGENLNRFGDAPISPLRDYTRPVDLLAQGAPPSKRPGVGARLVGSAETVLSVLTGGLLEIPAGVIGLTDGIAALVAGDADPLARTVDRIQSIRGLGYQPKTEAGKDIMGMVAVPFQKLGEVATGAGEATLEATGSPALATAAQVGIELLPSLLGVRRRPGAPTMGQRRREVAKLEGYAKDIEFDLEAPSAAQIEQLTAGAEKMVGGRTFQGRDMDLLQDAVQAARQTTKEMVDTLYADARATDAGVRVVNARKFERDVRNSLESFDIDTMPIVERRLNELSDISTLPDNAIVKLNAIAKYRQRLNRNKPAATDTSQRAALGIIKGELDAFLEGQFNADMITGNPQAVIKWGMATNAFKAYKETFDANRTIKQLVEKQATPQEIRNWIFGASAVGAKKQAADVVKRLKDMLGEDSPQFQALRQDALLDIVKPLLDEEPNLQQFRTNYDRFMRANDTLAKELFPDSVSDLDKLRAFAAAVEKNPKAKFGMDMNTAISRVLFGHGIAKAAMRVTLAGQVIALIRRVSGQTERNRIMGEILGYDPSTPLIPTTPAVISGISQTLQREGENNARD